MTEVAPDWGDERGTHVWTDDTLLQPGQWLALWARDYGTALMERRLPWLEDLDGLTIAADRLWGLCDDRVSVIIEAEALLEARLDPRWPESDRGATMVGLVLVRQLRRWASVVGDEAERLAIEAAD